MSYKLSDDLIPSWFEYPKEFLKIINLPIVNITPWYILEGEFLRQKFNGLKERFPASDLVPFAKRDDNDDVACWSKDDPKKIVVIHDFASQGWEITRVYNTFWEWFKDAVDTMIEFD